MKKIIYFLGILDALSFIRYGKESIVGYQEFSHDNLLLKVVAIIGLFLWISFLISALGFFLFKRWALILSYVQFPFRIIYAFFSFGWFFYFLSTYSYQEFKNTMPIFYLCSILELIRLTTTIVLHLKNETKALGR